VRHTAQFKDQSSEAARSSAAKTAFWGVLIKAVNCVSLNVRFDLKATEFLGRRKMTQWANSGLMHRSKV
jgi:hypothetical protein